MFFNLTNYSEKLKNCNYANRLVLCKLKEKYVALLQKNVLD